MKSIRFMHYFKKHSDSKSITIHNISCKTLKFHLKRKKKNVNDNVSKDPYDSKF